MAELGAECHTGGNPGTDLLQRHHSSWLTDGAAMALEVTYSGPTAIRGEGPVPLLPILPTWPQATLQPTGQGKAARSLGSRSPHREGVMRVSSPPTQYPSSSTRLSRPSHPSHNSLHGKQLLSNSFQCGERPSKYIAVEKSLNGDRCCISLWEGLYLYESSSRSNPISPHT